MWFIQLRIWCCHCKGLGHCYVSESTLGPWTSACLGYNSGLGGKVKTLNFIGYSGKTVVSYFHLFRSFPPLHLPSPFGHSTLRLLCNSIIFYFFLFFFFFSFQGHTYGILKFPVQGSNKSCSCQSIPQPQQRGIPTTYETYTTAHRSAASLSH